MHIRRVSQLNGTPIIRPTPLPQTLDATMPVYELKTLSAQLDETLRTDRLIALLSAEPARLLGHRATAAPA